MTGRDVGPAGSGVKLTYDDFVQFPDDGTRHELIDGEHYVTPSPNTRHQRISGVLYALIWNYLETNPIGKVFHAPLDVVFTKFDVVEPDLVYMSNQRATKILTSANVQGVPELMIEIASPGTRKRDAGVKRDLYGRSGVSEYWLVEPEGESVRVFRRGDNRFAPPERLTRVAGDVLTSQLLPGLTISLARVFRD